MQPLDHLGYSPKWVDIINKLVKAYADDLTLITKSVQGSQLAVDYTQKWLKWTETMKAKPKKCVCVGFKKFGTNVTSTFNPIKNTAFSPFDSKF